MPLRYASGEPIVKGDRIRYSGGDGVVEFVAEAGVSDPETEYFVDEFGGGCMLITERMGRVFIDAALIDEDIELVGRANG